MRPSHLLFFILALLALFNGGLLLYDAQLRSSQESNAHRLNIAAAAMGLTDLCVATEARYTRHPAISDPVAPFMDHPGALEHFPSGSFWAPPPIMHQNAPGHDKKNI